MRCWGVHWVGGHGFVARDLHFVRQRDELEATLNTNILWLEHLLQG